MANKINGMLPNSIIDSKIPMSTYERSEQQSKVIYWQQVNNLTARLALKLSRPSFHNLPKNHFAALGMCLYWQIYYH